MMANDSKDSKPTNAAKATKKDPTAEPKPDGVGKASKRAKKAQEIKDRASRIKSLEAELEPLRQKRKGKSLSEDEEFTYLRLSSEYDQLRIEQTRAQASRAQSRLASQARVKASERHKRLGEMVVRENLDKLLNPIELLGLFVEAAERAKNADQRAAWLERGTSVKAEREAESKPVGEPLFIRFPTEVGADAKQELRRFGFTWNKLWKHWEGLADFDQASTLAQKHGGTAHRPGAAR